MTGVHSQFGSYISTSTSELVRQNRYIWRVPGHPAVLGPGARATCDVINISDVKSFRGTNPAGCERSALATPRPTAELRHSGPITRISKVNMMLSPVIRPHRRRALSFAAAYKVMTGFVFGKGVNKNCRRRICPNVQKRVKFTDEFDYVMYQMCTKTCEQYLLYVIQWVLSTSALYVTAQGYLSRLS